MATQLSVSSALTNISPGYLEEIIVDQSQFLVVHVCRVVGNRLLPHPALPLTEDVPAGGGGHRPALHCGGGEREGVSLKEKISAGREKLETENHKHARNKIYTVIIIVNMLQIDKLYLLHNILHLL